MSIPSEPPFPEAQLAQILQAHPDDTQGLLLRLAWRCGLERQEMVDLQWCQITPAAIQLDDRQVPLEREVSAFLTAWQALCAPFASPYVVHSKRSRMHMCGAAISQMVHRTLVAEGLDSITLITLRRQYIQRQIASVGLAEGLRRAGLPLSTFYRDKSWRAWRAQQEDAPALADTAGSATGPFFLDPHTESQLHTFLASESDTLVGLALRLAYDLHLSTGEMVSMTWSDLSLTQHTLHVAGQDYTLSRETVEHLLSIWHTRTAEDDPHVFLTEHTRRPMDKSWLLTIVRSALIQAGLGSVTLRAIRCHATNTSRDRIILDAVDRQGALSSEDVAALLHLSRHAATPHLRSLTARGKLVRVHSYYVRPEDAVTEQNRKPKLLACLMDRGPSTAGDLADTLHIARRLTSRILRELVQDGAASYDRSTGLYAYVEVQGAPESTPC